MDKIGLIVKLKVCCTKTKSNKRIKFTDCTIEKKKSKTIDYLRLESGLRALIDFTNFWL